jgi:serine/threonine-protein kinase RsbW
VSRLRLVIDSDLGDVSLVAVAVNKICVHLGLDESQAAQVELSTAEAITNVIRHAYRGKAGQTITIEVSTGIDRLHLEISDSGVPMPYEHAEKLHRGTKVVEVDAGDRASLAEGGRGLQIIHDLMDEVAYIRDGQVNRLQMTKRIPPNPEQ